MKYMYLVIYEDSSSEFSNVKISKVIILHPLNLVAWCEHKRIYDVKLIQKIKE